LGLPLSNLARYLPAKIETKNGGKPSVQMVLVK
jgi:hypothetical protein